MKYKWELCYFNLWKVTSFTNSKYTVIDVDVWQDELWDELNRRLD
jgi:hypothetical protein